MQWATVLRHFSFLLYVSVFVALWCFNGIDEQTKSGFERVQWFELCEIRSSVDMKASANTVQPAQGSVIETDA